MSATIPRGDLLGEATGLEKVGRIGRTPADFSGFPRAISEDRLMLVVRHAKRLLA
jgi:hypothetical protein